MPRPKRCRIVGQTPEFRSFRPDGIPCESSISLGRDEFEAIRLVDCLGLSHEQAAQSMDVSRTTMSEIVESARKKIADCLVYGKPLIVDGGNIKLDDAVYDRIKLITPKGENVMRIATPHENGEICQHFGHAPEFKFFDIEEGKIVHTEVVPTEEGGHDAVAAFLNANNVDAVVCGSIGTGAQIALAELGIQMFGGASGNPDDIINGILNGTIVPEDQVECSCGCGGHDHGSCGCGGHDHHGGGCGCH